MATHMIEMPPASDELICNADDEMLMKEITEFNAVGRPLGEDEKKLLRIKCASA